MGGDTVPARDELRTWALGAALISVQIVLTTAAACAALVALVWVFSFRPSFELPLPVRWAGLVGVAIGAGLTVDTLRYRHPKEMLISTSITLRRFFGRIPIERRTGPIESFSVTGPYRYVRIPLYLGVVVLVVGLGLLDQSAFLLAWALVLVGWFWFLLIPFEERELQALFGERFARYCREVPKLLPHGRGYRDPGGTHRP